MLRVRGVAGSRRRSRTRLIPTVVCRGACAGQKEPIGVEAPEVVRHTRHFAVDEGPAPW